MILYPSRVVCYIIVTMDNEPLDHNYYLALSIGRKEAMSVSLFHEIRMTGRYALSVPPLK